MKIACRDMNCYSAADLLFTASTLTILPLVQRCSTWFVAVATDDEMQIASAPLVHCSRHDFVCSRWVVAVDELASILIIKSALSGAKLEEILEKYGDVTIGCSPLLRLPL